MINQSDKIKDFPEQFNALEKRLESLENLVKFIEKRITDIEIRLNKV